MIPAAKEKIASVIEATEESFQGIGEGFKHGATIFTGMGVGAAQNVTTSTEERIQNVSHEIPNVMKDIAKGTESIGSSVEKSVEETKQKGIPTKISEKLESAKQEASASPNVQETSSKNIFGL